LHEIAVEAATEREAKEEALRLIEARARGDG
jgi:hypothetical protein